MNDIQVLITNFVSDLQVAIISNITANVTAAFGEPRRGPGRPPSNPNARKGSTLQSLFTEMGEKTRTHKPQLCPVPGCKNRAAPVFGMVCADHKKVSKKLIASYRRARREGKTLAVTASPKTAPAKKTAAKKKAPAKKGKK